MLVAETFLVDNDLGVEIKTLVFVRISLASPGALTPVLIGVINDVFVLRYRFIVDDFLVAAVVVDNDLGAAMKILVFVKISFDGSGVLISVLFGVANDIFVLMYAFVFDDFLAPVVGVASCIARKKKNVQPDY